MNYKLTLLLLTLWLFNSHVPLIAQPGMDDPTFNVDFGFGATTNFPEQTLAFNRYLDNKFMISSGASGIINRLKADGTLDDTFTSSTLGGIVYSFATQQDGKILVVGSFPKGIVRLNANGSIDETYNVGGVGATRTDLDPPAIYSIAIQVDDKIIIGGYFNGFNTTTRKNIARLNADGTVDVTFNPGTGASNGVSEIIVRDDGKILIGGYFTSYNDTPRSRIALINSNGTLDNQFNPSGPGQFDGAVEAILLQNDGKILVAGSFLNFNGVPRGRITRLNSDGSTDISFIASGVGSGSSVTGMDIDINGSIYVSGSFNAFNAVTAKGIVKLTSDGIVDPTFKPYEGLNNIDIGQKYVLLNNSGKVIIAGNFTKVNGTERKFIVSLNSDGSLEGGRGADNTIRSIAKDSNGRIVIAGGFTGYNGRGRNRLAKLNIDGTLDETFNITGANNTINKVVNLTDGKLLIAGDFTTFNDQPRSKIARANSDGTLDTSFDPGLGADGSVQDIAIQQDGKIIIGGDFTNFNGTPRNRIARLNTNGTLDSEFNPGTGMNDVVRSILPISNGKILIAGDFTAVNAVANNRLVLLNADGSIDDSFNIGSGADGTITSSVLQPDGKILIAGVFLEFNGVEKNKVVRINVDGTIDITFNPSSLIDDYVRSIILQANGKIILSGDFASKLIRLNTDGSVDADFNVGVGANNSILTTLLMDDGNIVVAGNFTNYNGVQRDRIYRILGGEKLEQEIMFSSIENKTFGDVPFALGAVATSDLDINYTVEPSSKLSITNGIATILEAGSVTVTASQEGNTFFKPANDVSNTFCINPEKPTITASLNNFFQPVLTSSSPTGNQWYRDNIELENSNNASITVDIEGSYTVRVTVEGCTGEISEGYAVVITDLEDGRTNISVWPNPTIDYLNISGIENFSTKRIVNALGIEQTATFKKSKEHSSFDVSKLPTGIYFLQLRSSNQNQTIRFVKH